MSEKRKRASSEQIVALLHQADAMLRAGQDLALVLQRLGISQATYDRWLREHGHRMSETAKQIRQLERENARLKREIADAQLDQAILREALRWIDEEQRK
jgi:transposase-like protein